MFLIFWRYSLKLILNCSYFLIFPNSGLVARNNKKALRNTYLLLFHPAVCKKKINETVNTALANVTSLLITVPAPVILTSLCIHVHLNLCTRIK